MRSLEPGGRLPSVQGHAVGRVDVFPREQSFLERRFSAALCRAAQPCSFQCLSDLLPTSCSGMAAGVAFHLSERNKEYTVYQWFMHVCVSRKMGEAIEDLYILVSGKFDDFPVGFWCGLWGIGSTCSCPVVPLGVSVAASFSVVVRVSSFATGKKAL